jgi:hypothetical protein
MADRRRNREDPPAVARFGWRYHHLGIPYSSPRDGELHLKKLGVHVCGFETSPYGVEWRFDTHCQVPEIVKTVPHLAFVVDNLDTALQGKPILIPPNSPSPGCGSRSSWMMGRPLNCWNLLQIPANRRT